MFIFSSFGVVFGIQNSGNTDGAVLATGAESPVNCGSMVADMICDRTNQDYVQNLSLTSADSCSNWCDGLSSEYSCCGYVELNGEKKCAAYKNLFMSSANNALEGLSCAKNLSYGLNCGPMQESKFCYMSSGVYTDFMVVGSEASFSSAQACNDWCSSPSNSEISCCMFTNQVIEGQEQNVCLGFNNSNFVLENIGENDDLSCANEITHEAIVCSTLGNRDDCEVASSFCEVETKSFLLFGIIPLPFVQVFDSCIDIPIISCPAGEVTWGASNACSGSISEGNVGVTNSVINIASDLEGNSSYTCLETGEWNLNLGSTCNDITTCTSTCPVANTICQGTTDTRADGCDGTCNVVGTKTDGDCNNADPGTPGTDLGITCSYTAGTSYTWGGGCNGACGTSVSNQPLDYHLNCNIGSNTLSLVCEDNGQFSVDEDLSICQGITGDTDPGTPGTGTPDPGNTPPSEPGTDPADPGTDTVTADSKVTISGSRHEFSVLALLNNEAEITSFNSSSFTYKITSADGDLYICDGQFVIVNGALTCYDLIIDNLNDWNPYFIDHSINFWKDCAFSNYPNFCISSAYNNLFENGNIDCSDDRARLVVENIEGINVINGYCINEDKTLKNRGYVNVLTSHSSTGSPVAFNGYTQYVSYNDELYSVCVENNDCQDEAHRYFINPLFGEDDVVVCMDTDYSGDEKICYYDSVIEGNDLPTILNFAQSVFTEDSRISSINFDSFELNSAGTNYDCSYVLVVIDKVLNCQDNSDLFESFLNIAGNNIFKCVNGGTNNVCNSLSDDTSCRLSYSVTNDAFDCSNSESYCVGEGQEFNYCNDEDYGDKVVVSCSNPGILNSNGVCMGVYTDSNGNHDYFDGYHLDMNSGDIYTSLRDYLNSIADDTSTTTTWSCYDSYGQVVEDAGTYSNYNDCITDLDCRDWLGECYEDGTQVTGKCGSAQRGFFSSIPTENLCNVGDPTTPIVYNNLWKWRCNGLNGGTSSSTCLATKSDPTPVTSPSCTLSWNPTDTVQAGNRLILSWTLSEGAQIVDANCKIINEDIVRQYISGNSLDFNPLPDYGGDDVEEECSISVELAGSINTCSSGSIKITKNSCKVPEGDLSGPERLVLPGNYGFVADSLNHVLYGQCGVDFNWRVVSIFDCTSEYGSSSNGIASASAEDIYDFCDPII